MVTLANEFSRRGIQTDLVLVKNEGPFSDDISPKVNVFNLNASRTILSLFRLIRYLQQEQPDGLLATLAGTNVVAALAHRLSGSSGSLVLRETNSVSEALNRYDSLKGKAIHLAAFGAYSYSDYVVGISKGLSEDVVNTFRVNSNDVVTIYNPVVTSQHLAENTNGRHEIKKDIPIVLGAGRLVEQKSFATLIRAFARLRSRRQARLYIIGEGDQRPQLFALACRLGVEEDVHMPGFVDNPFAYMGEADVFVLSSQWEGFGNVLVEAMACGTPVVSTDCPSGPSEILEDGKWGRLVRVGDEAMMAKAICRAIDDPPPKGLKKRAKDFHVRTIADQYLSILENN